MSSNWQWSTLGEVCEVRNGATPDTNIPHYWDGPHAWVTPAEMGGLDSPFLSKTRRTLTDQGLAACSASLAPEKSVILSSRAPIGHLIINEVPMATNQGCKTLVPSRSLNFKFLYYFLKANVPLLDSLGTGATFRELSAGKLKEVTIPVPPLAEQQRIVAKLDETRSLTRQLLAAGEKARTALTDLRRSWMRSELENASSSMVMELGSFCDIYQPQTIGVKDLVEDGDFEVFGANGRIGRFNRYNHEESEVTVTCRGATCGTVNVTPPKVWITGNAMVIRPKPEVMTKEMLAVVMRSLDYSGVITGAAQPQITRRTLAPTVVPVLPLPEQHLVVERIENAQQLTSDLAMAWESKLRFVRDLEQSMLAAAFRGDL